MIFEIALLAIGFIVTITALVLSDGTSWVPIIVAGGGLGIICFALLHQQWRQQNELRGPKRRRW